MTNIYCWHCGQKYKFSQQNSISNEKFKEFLQENKELIDSITPKNPTILKDDEWSTDPIYEQWSQDEYQKQREEYKRDFREYCEWREKEEKVIGFRILD